jgi:hypothetical protein
LPATPLVGTSIFYTTVRVTDRAAIFPAPPEVDAYTVYNTVRVLIQRGHLVRYLRHRWSPPPSTQRSGCRGQGGHLACHAIGGHLHHLHDSQGNGQGVYLAAPLWVGISTFYETAMVGKTRRS